MSPSVMLGLTLAHLLISFACGQTDNALPCNAPQMLNLDGCPVFVHDVTGTKDFEVEPLMCVTQNLSNVLPQIDPVTQKMFVSVPVTLRDDAMIGEIKNELQHLSPNSVKFATVSDIRVSVDASSPFLEILWFLWSPDEPIGYVALGCNNASEICTNFHIKFRGSNAYSVHSINAVANVELGRQQTELKYKLVTKNQNFVDPEYFDSRFHCLSRCDSLQYLGSFDVGGCTARVHQMQSEKQFYIEPLLCDKTTRLSYDQIRFDDSRNKHYLNLPLVLQDGETLTAVKSKINHLSPANVSFMQLSQVKVQLSSYLSNRFDIGPLMVSGDGLSGQVRVHCKTHDDCLNLRSEIQANRLSFWSYVTFDSKLQIDNHCTVKSNAHFYNLRLPEVPSTWLLEDTYKDAVAQLGFKYPIKIVEDRTFVIIQQRKTAVMSFARDWKEYEDGFGVGDAANFWIGLSAIHSFSKKGVTFRVEMKVNGREIVQEYAGFKVGDASTNYTLTCEELILKRSTSNFNSMTSAMGMQFSTRDRDNDKYESSCADKAGGVGWWYKECGIANPNGKFGSQIMWALKGFHKPVFTEIRLMLQI